MSKTLVCMYCKQNWDIPDTEFIPKSPMCWNCETTRMPMKNVKLEAIHCDLCGKVVGMTRGNNWSDKAVLITCFECQKEADVDKYGYNEPGVESADEDEEPTLLDEVTGRA